jgi:hypothetical protein
MESEYWACSVCRSMNPLRSGRCYSCQTPREVAGVKPGEIPVMGTLPPPVVTSTFRSAEGRAVTLTIATVLFILVTGVSLWMLWNINNLRAAGESTSANELLLRRAPILVLSPLLGIVALVSYAAWISRVVENLPALGLGYSRVSPTMAFFEPLIPGVNLYSLPARAGEVVAKLEGNGRGMALIGLGWLLGFGPLVVGAWITRIGRVTEDGADLLRTLGATFLGAFAFQAVGLAIGLYVVWHIEGLCRVAATTPPAPREPAAT